MAIKYARLTRQSGFWLIVVVLMALVTPCRAKPLDTLRYSAGEVIDDSRYQYYWDLISAALDITRSRYGRVTLVPVSERMNGDRVVNEIRSGGRVDIMVRATSRKLENTLLPVRIPLDKGLCGYRLFLLRSQDQSRLARVTSLAGLGAFSIGQQDNWVDVDILRDAGLNVVTANHYEGLFAMLNLGRFELLPRGVNEIGREYAVFKTRYPGMVIDSSLLLYYPLPRYVFVPPTPEGRQLAARLEEGLRLLQANGEFERRYQSFKAAVLAGINLSGRRVIRIPNPYLPEATPLRVSAFWDSLNRELAPRR